MWPRRHVAGTGPQPHLDVCATQITGRTGPPRTAATAARRTVTSGQLVAEMEINKEINK